LPWIDIEWQRRIDYKFAPYFLYLTGERREEATMRLVFHAALLSGMAAFAAARGDEFPYEAYIAADKTEVVAGPGHRFYATDRLARGTKIEIYREEPSGWLAIRPPEGSFSWVPGEFVERLDDAMLGRIKEPAGAWIGTSVEHVNEHQQQVTLKTGELVQILTEKSVAAHGGAQQTWLKIAPPAGEYRWVHLRDVSRQKPEEPVTPLAAEVEAAPEPEQPAPALSPREKEQAEPRRLVSAGNGIALRDIDEPAFAAPRLDRHVEPAQYRTTTSGNESRPVSSDGFVPRKRRGDEPSNGAGSAPIRTTTTPPTTRPWLDSDARLATATPRLAPSNASPSTASGASPGSDDFARQLEQIEIDLSLMVAQERSQWDLSALRRRVESLVESGADPTSRGRARLVLAKIKKFEDAFDRDPRTVAGGQRSTAGQAGSATTTQPVSSSLADPRYDAQGWLKPVVSRKSDKPIAPFAVVDAEGQPICFVSPSPGLNLHRYENKQVGLYGRRGYLEELKKPHLVVERVIELDGRWR
jgi:hypothetical protein